MAPLQTGFQELARKWRRLLLWAALWRSERAVARAEAELGALGWEQMDFFDDAINAEVDRLREYERNEVSLINVSAELSGKLAELEKELAEEGARHAQARQALENARQEPAENLTRLEEARRVKTEIRERFRRAMIELRQEQEKQEARRREAQRAAANVVQAAAARVSAEREIARAQKELQRVREDEGRVAGELSELESEAARVRESLRIADQNIAEERARFTEIEAHLGAQVREIHEEKKKSGSRLSSLEGEKQKPYRAIGACLADHQLAPRNQPEVLDKVLGVRAEQQDLQDERAALLAASEAANATALRWFYVLAGALILTLAVAAVCLLHR